ICSANETYRCCGSCVQRTCALEDDTNCPDVCNKGCYCRKGYVRKYANGPCIPQKKCPRTIPTQAPSNPDTTYAEVTTPGPDTTANPDTTNAEVTTPGSDTTVAEVTPETGTSTPNPDTTNAEVTTLGPDTTVAEVTTETETETTTPNPDTTNAEVSTPGPDTTVAEVTTETGTTTSNPDTTNAEVTTPGPDTTVVEVTTGTETTTPNPDTTNAEKLKLLPQILILLMLKLLLLVQTQLLQKRQLKLELQLQIQILLLGQIQLLQKPDTTVAEVTTNTETTTPIPDPTNAEVTVTTTPNPDTTTVTTTTAATTLSGSTTVHTTSLTPTPIPSSTRPSTTTVVTRTQTTTPPRTTTIESRNCGPNETFLTCGLCSYNTCRGWVGCLDQRCVRGCFCKVGYVRAYPKGPCVTVRACPDPTCATQDGPICPDVCYKGCYCRKGFIRKYPNGPFAMKYALVLLVACLACVCWAQDEKFVPNNSVLTCVRHTDCGPNETYRCCGMCFEQNCSDMSTNKQCASRCYKGCYCANGYTRKREGGFCVPDKECRSVLKAGYPIVYPKCPVNEVYTCCGPCVQKTCKKQLNQVYCLICPEGCVCKD
uniref:TIL domain-containing protein n=1 Tax=Anopheles dirus TaxID=7168 RepID=A0A182NFI3_9DIPT